MDKYRSYMDSAVPSAEFRQKLKGLSAPKRAPMWKRYGAVAAALALVIGLGGWGISRLPGDGGAELNGPLPELGEPAVVPEPAPDPGVIGQHPVGGGYEIADGEVMSYYMLPYIEYEQAEELVSGDIALPVGVYRRDLTREELLALLDGEQNLTLHLNWGGYEVQAFAMLHRDGSLWRLSVEGVGAGDGSGRFTLEICPGEIPASCLIHPGGTVNEVWGTPVEAVAHDGQSAFFRQVSFFRGDYGYRFEIHGADREAVEDTAARAVRFFVLDCAPYFASEGSAEAYTGGNVGEENTLPWDPHGGPQEET